MATRKKTSKKTSTGNELRVITSPPVETTPDPASDDDDGGTIVTIDNSKVYPVAEQIMRSLLPELEIMECAAALCTVIFCLSAGGKHDFLGLINDVYPQFTRVAKEKMGAS